MFITEEFIIAQNEDESGSGEEGGNTDEGTEGSSGDDGERRDTDNDSNRPLPDPPRLPTDMEHMNVYALVVGIDDYQGSEISKLGGCVADTKLVSDYLRTRFGPRLKLKVLTDIDATYDKIIEAFDDHLVNGGGTGNDTFWFHFSGHGSEQFTATQFFKPKDAAGNELATLAPNGKDQTLVCYNPGGTTRGIFLADKEIAALLRKIHDNAISIGQKKPHVMVTLDCCHSGSGTRAEDGVRTRKFDFLNDKKNRSSLDNPDGSIRDIHSYYGGYYSKHAEDQSNLRVPTSQHLLISGCTNLELAGDTDRGGVFTTSLIDTLTESMDAGEPVNYVDLFTWTRAKAKAERHTQTPQFEPVANFNPYTRVLEGWSLGGPGKFEIKKKGDNWYVRAGAVNGLPAIDKDKPEEKVQILIYTAQGEQLMGSAEVDKVGVQDSRLNLLNAVRSENVLTLDDETHYVAEIFTLPAAPLYVRLEGDAPAVEALKSQWDKQADKNSINLENLNIIAVTGDNSPEKPEVSIEARQVEVEGEMKNTFVFHNLENGKVWTKIGTGVEEPIELAKVAVDKIARWKRMITLGNEKSKIQHLYELEFLTGSFSDFENAGGPDPDEERGAFLQTLKPQSIDEREVTVAATSETLFDMEDFEAIPYLFRVKTLSSKQNLHFYLYSLEENCGISLHDPGELHLENTITDQVNEFGTDFGMFELKHNDQKVTYWFKLFVTRQPIEKEALTQEPFGPTRKLRKFSLSSKTEDWHCTTVKVTVKRS